MDVLERFPAHLRPQIDALGHDPEFEEIHAALSTPVDERGLTRRRFLQAAAVTGGATALTLGPLGRAAEALTPLGEGDPILLCIQLGGGNDGLNTVVPAQDPAYGRLRPATSVASGALPLHEGGLFLHPALPKLAARYAQRKVAIVRGVGNVDLDHSHFSSMATWMAGTSGADRSTGWLGRLLDTMPDSPDGLRGVTLDASIPLNLLGARSQVSSLGGLGPFGSNRTAASDTVLFDSLRLLGTGSTRGALGNAVGAANRLGIDRARDFASAYGSPSGPTDSTLTTQLYRAARVINANVGARVLGATLASFDTHRDQRWMHNHLLADLDNAIDTFYKTLSPRWADQVVIMTFSEFGRRATDNGSGTDHGTSSPLFVIGDRVRGGLHGAQPSLTDLDSRGDLAVTVDFRRVYATVTSRWFGIDPKTVLGANFAELDLFSSRPQLAKVASVPAESKFKPFRDGGAFVDQQYADFLDRVPTAKQRASWVKRVRSNSTTMAAGLVEFYRASPYSRQALPINRTSIALTGAPASFDDLQRWMALHTTSGMAPIVAELVNLPGFRARYSRLWGTNLLTRLHQDLTGTTITSARINAWKARIDADVQQGSIAFITALVSTPEATKRFRFEAEAASGHTAMLRRAPSASSTASWGAKLRGGTSVASMLWSFYRVAEYRRRFT